MLLIVLVFVILIVFNYDPSKDFTIKKGNGTFYRRSGNFDNWDDGSGHSDGGNSEGD
ncbi:MAG: hypothetical protein IPN29_20385 [Saprospiraceae bacterium]|nr:hypothetical protein [Saprospiraceae bacterium]